MKVINEDLSLNCLKFRILDNDYLVVKTENVDNTMYNTIDKIVNLQTGEFKRYRRADLSTMIYKYQAKKVDILPSDFEFLLNRH